MKRKILFPLSLTLAFHSCYCHENENQEKSNEIEMNYTIEQPQKKLSIENLESDLLQSVLNGYLDYFSSGSFYSQLPEAYFKDTNQHIIYAWGLNHVGVNGIIEKNANRIPTHEEIDQMIEFFSAKRIPFVWWTSAKILENRGFQFGGIFTGIALNISQGLPTKPSMPSNLKIKIVESENELETFTKLAAETFYLNTNATKQWGNLNDSLMQNGEQVHFIAYLDEIPVGTATLSVSSSSSGIWNLATLPEYRKRGIGTALVHATLVEAKKRQYKEVMALLMPTGMAWGLFKKLGFNAFYEFPFYIYETSAEKTEK